MSWNGDSTYIQAVRYHAYLSRGRPPGSRLVVLEMDAGVKFKLGDEFMHKTRIYVVTDVKPGYDKFDAVLFADLAGHESDAGQTASTTETGQLP